MATLEEACCIYERVRVYVPDELCHRRTGPGLLLAFARVQ